MDFFDLVNCKIELQNIAIGSIFLRGGLAFPIKESRPLNFHWTMYFLGISAPATNASFPILHI